MAEPSTSSPASATYHKLVRGSYQRWEGTVERDPENPRRTIKEGAFTRYSADDNNVIQNLTLGEIKLLGDRVVEVSGPSSRKTKEEEPDYSYFTNLKATEAILYVEDNDKLDELENLLAAEAADKNRVTVVEALRQRIEDLKS